MQFTIEQIMVFLGIYQQSCNDKPGFITIYTTTTIENLEKGAVIYRAMVDAGLIYKNSEGLYRVTAKGAIMAAQIEIDFNKKNSDFNANNSVKNVTVGINEITLEQFVNLCPDIKYESNYVDEITIFIPAHYENKIGSFDNAMFSENQLVKKVIVGLGFDYAKKEGECWIYVPGGFKCTIKLKN